ncbi:ATP-binding protein (plasmid) [Coraliomargarita sp. W4R53]
MDVAPSVRLLESMRSVGYSFEAALADLIDNSITAGATAIEIDADVVGAEFVAILDNGRGMSSDVAREALRLAGDAGVRSTDDLGRFGLGLKTASLSQGRSVTVVTRQADVVTALRWDIDHVLESGRWSLLVLEDEDTRQLPLWGAFDAQESGTLIVWQSLDLLLGDTYDRGAYLRDLLIDARMNLAVTFHRFLRRGRAGLTVRVNGTKLDPIDPFLESNPRTQISPTDELSIRGERVEVTAFTLPHPSGLTPAERARKDLSSGMREAQGFYIYRNRRLISYGSWYGLSAKSEITKQTRIRVDIPNTLDDLWQLDIKKSRAEPPASFKSHLRRLIEPLLDRGRRVHTYRGRRESEAHVTRVWDKIVDRQGRVTYVVNVAHPLLDALRSQLPSDQVLLLDSVLETLSTGFPAQDLYAVMAASGATVEDLPVEEDVTTKLKLLQEAGALGASSEEAAALLSGVEPFNKVPNLLDLVDRVIGGGAHGAH